ncbi:Mitogen-activated kinase kinase kinase 13-A [Chlorella sorokiniana]|uniref:Mitogen-activated kinase kinase kinase 13-A n=1 Tax=Chlorella sorokiniana TaxID=3076 RepID=A0A2P6TW53_CHLSO|nr:Mitogen-activated kinase kinase kinase 13-A [Chlorella sorokiniana]|eukprot:PRW58290.1 Mitogen-activated kinase kinase kinase 13-A [Chlorella sorokiniana]
MCRFALGLTLLALLALAALTNARKVEVEDAEAMLKAVADPSVTEIVLQHGGRFNITAASRPAEAIQLRGRQLLMRGPQPGGAPTLVDGGGQSMVLQVIDGGRLVQQDLFVHDCILPTIPIFCFCYHGPHGHTELHNSTLADAHCSDTAASPGIKFVLGALLVAASRGKPPVQLDARRVWIEDSGVMATQETGGTWLFKNVTLMCTGSDTYPARNKLHELLQLPLSTPAALLAAALACAVAAAWQRSRSNRPGGLLLSDNLPEVAAARERGILIAERIGRGTFGEVYRGTLMRTGEVVAVKILQFPASEHKQARRVIRECRIAASTSHPNCVATHSHFTISVRRRLVHTHDASRSSGSTNWEKDGGYYFDQEYSCLDEDQDWETRFSSQLGSGSSEARSSRPGRASSAGRPQPSPLLLTCLVMEFCGSGTLNQAIQRGAFYCDTGQRELHEEFILRTARDIARGLDHLHSVLSLVHRDLSTNNVLLSPDAHDPRGFAAKLSDFGLSVAKQQWRTATTLEGKGTLAFMPPEAFGNDTEKLSETLDVYSMGICVYCMCSGGKSPYPDLTSYQLVARKMREAHQLAEGKPAAQLEPPPGTPSRLQAFIRRCCCDAEHRWSADDAAAPLAAKWRRALRLVLLALVYLHGAADAQQAAGRRVQVSTVPDLRDALADETVSQVLVMPSGTWNFSREEWGAGAVRLHRPVVMEGVPGPDGKPPYADLNQLTELVVVGANGSLHQRGIYVDDCMLPVMPLLCFAVGADEGSLMMEQLVICDASCTDISRSTAADWLLKSAYWATWKTSWVRVDERTIHINDTGDIRRMPPGVTWRILNSTFRCTGNDTHPLPAAAAGSSDDSSKARFATAMVAAMAMLVAGAYWLVNRNVVTVRPDENAEMAVARAKGIALLGVIGTGTFGRVYRAQYRGRTVAIKVLDFADADKRAAEQVNRECQYLMACRHPCITTCLTFFNVTVRCHGSRRERLLASRYLLAPDFANPQRQPEAGSGSERTSGGGEPAATAPAAAAAAPAAGQPALPAGEDQPSSSSAAATAQGPQVEAGGGTPTSTDGSDTSSLGGPTEGSMALLVMEYCSLGNLHRAITAGRFHGARRQPNLDWACRTALDVALGLDYIHTQQRVVHRDVSTNNILLALNPHDPRGFSAKLSDFGLSTVLAARQTHRTSQLKGTVDFMPPEMFTSGEVRFAVDIYSLGIVIYWLVAGEGPYAGLPPYQVVGRKLSEAHHKARLHLPNTMPPDLKRLVWDCTHSDPRERPTAAEVARRLAEITTTLDQPELAGQQAGSDSSD